MKLKQVTLEGFRHVLHRGISAEERFRTQTWRDESTGCLLWTGRNAGNSGYWRFMVDGKKVLVHRYAYELAKGPIPKGFHIDHLCRNRMCVEETHLEAVTPRENLMRGNAPAAKNVAKTHCPQGHPYDSENTYTHNNKRSCRTCNRAKVQRFNARQREKVAL